VRTIVLAILVALTAGFVVLFVTADDPASDGSLESSDAGTSDPGRSDTERGDPTPDHVYPFTSSSQCKECHPGVYREWVESQHELAWKNPLVAQISNQFQNKICIDCHAPRPVLRSGLGVRVLARATERDDGVNCFSCHDMDGGRMAATREGLDAPCNPVYDPRLRSVEHCAVCHNQHGTVDEWYETDFATMDPPMDCIACHMPQVERRLPDGRTYTGRDHRMLAAHDLAVIRQAPVLEASIEGDEVAVSVTNKGAGHNFPTDERHRAVDLVVRILDDEGNLVGEERRDRYRNPYRDEVGLQNTQIPWGETRSYRYPLEVPAGRVEVVLIYKLTPYMSDEEGQEIVRKELSFP